MTRQLIISIDGDGSQNPEWDEKILYLIKKYSTIKFTVSVIVAYFDGTIFPENKEELTGIVREIFSQPNVEPANHSWSHPKDWTKPEQTSLIPNHRWNLPQEIQYSSDFIEQHLTDKKLKIFLLTGECNPTPEDLKMIYERGLIPFNAFIENELPYGVVGGYRQWAQRAYPDCYYTGIRKYREENGQQVKYVDNPEGFKETIEYFKKHSERCVHVYFHFYAAEFPETYESVDFVLSEVMKMNLESLFISEYIKRNGG